MSSKFTYLLAAVAFASSAQAATLVPVPAVPGAVQTFVSGINDKNVIVGDYENADGSMHAFYGTLDGQYTTFDFDEVNLAGTEARGIDDHGNIVGIANVDAAMSTSAYAQFERFANGAMKRITDHRVPTAGLTGHLSPGRATFVVENWNEDNSVSGFIGKKAKTQSQIDLGLTTTRLRPRGITNSGDIVGFVTTGGKVQGFLLHDGTTTLLNYPDANTLITEIEDVNADGIITGFWEDADFNEFAFTYDENTASFKPITIPGFPNSGAGSINKAGLIAVQGYSADFSQSAPYIYCPKKKSKCPAGGTEIADAQPIRMPAGGIAHRVAQGAPKPLTRAHAAVLLRQ
ncbi:MAG TPA: hypothetical protein VHZ29_19590 [Rhizomicrobium sp.]|nr:hypothetical protein [Rhizomicrobium sp.]